MKNLKLTSQDGVSCIDYETEHGAASGCLHLVVIKMAWYAGLNLEKEADGFGKGMGTDGDWSAIRDSSPEATDAMLEKALNFLENCASLAPC